MKRVLIVAAAVGVLLASFQLVRAEPVPYGGSRFSEVWSLVTSDPYEVLPQRHVTLASFFDWFENRLLAASRRTLDDRSDVLPRFQKLLHPNGICLAGTWRITEDSPYTGYFAKGKSALIIARASTALSETKRGQARAFGLAGKLYPTTDPNHAEPLETANFFTIENLAGTYTPHFLDADNTNDILFIAPRPGALFNGPVGVAAAQAFSIADETLDVTQTTIRQLYPIAELGEPDPSKAVAPRWLKIVGSASTPRVDAWDFREELDIDEYPDGIRFDIYVADVGTRIGPKAWRYLGDILFEDSVASDSCDHRLHFSHPRFRRD